MKDLSAFIKKCEIDQKNLESTKEAYQACQDRVGGRLLWWQTTSGLISTSSLAFILGLFIASANR